MLVPLFCSDQAVRVKRLAVWCISRVDNRYGVDRMDGQLYIDELFAVREAGLGHHFRGKG